MIIPRVQKIPGENRVPEFLVGIIIPQLLATFFIVGRVISRVKILKIWSHDDTLIMLAWTSNAILTIMFGVSTMYGPGHHINDVPPKFLIVSFEITYATLMCYQMALAFTKLSILVFYLRVFPGRREQIMSWCTFAAVIGYSLPLLVANVLQCNPLTKHSFLGSNISCTQSGYTLKVSTILHTITDVWMVLMVIPVVWSLQLPKSQKYSLMGVLSLGGIVVVASIARILSITRHNGKAQDITWIIMEFDIWTAVETSIGLICACAPTLRPLLLKLFPVLMASRSGSRTKSRYSRRTMAERRLSGAIELRSQDPISVGGKTSDSQEGHWSEIRPVDDREIRNSPTQQNSGHPSYSKEMHMRRVSVESLT